MLFSDKIDLISPALVAAHKDMPVITKGKWNSHFQSHYADIADIRDEIRPVLAANDMVPLQSFTAKGAIVTVITVILHKSGQYVMTETSAEAKNASAQAVAAGVTFLCRYALIELLGLSVRDGADDDGNSTRKEEPASDGPQRDPIAHPADVFDVQTSWEDLKVELKKRNVPERRWEAIGKWLHGKSEKELTRAIAQA